MQPLVSVCVLSMNHDDYVLQCLESILAQDYENIEIIFVDNISQDRTFEIASSWLEKCGKPFKSVKNEKSYPAAYNGKQQLAMATGKYACMTSADDWLAPTNISSKVKRLMDDPMAAIAYSESYLFYDDTKELVSVRSPNRYEGFVFDLLVKGNFVVSPGIVWDLEKVRESGGYNEDAPIEDWDLILRVSKKYKILFVDEFLVYYRRHSGNESVANNKKYFYNQLKVLEQYKGHKNYRFSKQQIIYQLHYELTSSKPGLKNILDTLKIQDGSLYRLNILKHNILKFFRKKK